MKRPLISVCIPTYEMYGSGHIFLKHSFDVLTRQTFRDFDVIISDYSVTDVIKNVCAEYADRLDIRYFKNTNTDFSIIAKGAANSNNAILHADGVLIKMLFLDDFLYSEKSLEQIAENFDPKKDRWLVTACVHSRNGTDFFGTIYPKYHSKIHLGMNTISSPSVLTILNDNPLLFDTNMPYLMDCDYYKRCYDAFGLPKIVNEINVVNRIGAHQVVSNIDNKIALWEKDYEYAVRKFGERRTASGNARYILRKIKKKIKRKTQTIVHSLTT